MEDKAAASERRLVLKTRSPRKGEWGSVPLSSAKIAQAIEQQDRGMRMNSGIENFCANGVQIPYICISMELWRAG